MSNIRLIRTGGTISAFRAPKDGLIDISADTLVPLAKELGYDVPETKAYFGDSIGLNFGFSWAGDVLTNMQQQLHYINMLQEAMAALDVGDTPVICGGTDSKSWYATMLTKDLKRRGYLAENSRQKIIFLSSMKRPDENEKLVKDILQCGIVLAQQAKLSGGFAVSAENPEGTRFIVHDVDNDFTKISAHMTNAFRSGGLVGHVVNGTFEPDPDYVPPKLDKRLRDKRDDLKRYSYAHIAPPLISGKNVASVIAYLKAVSASDPPFNGVIIEGLPADNGARVDIKDYFELIETVRKLTDHDMRVVICKPRRYDAKSDSMREVDDQIWRNNRLLDQLTENGAEIVKGLPKDVYLDMMFTTPQYTRPLEQEKSKTDKHLHHFHVRYVPDLSVMTRGIDAVATLAKEITLFVLPDGTAPSVFYDEIEKHIENGVKINRTFEYVGAKYKGDDGKLFIESINTKSDYRIARRFCKNIPIAPMNDLPPHALAASQGHKR
jgi:hypothetical protein